MPEAQREKSTFDLSGGLNTEIHDLAWPDGLTSDEANYELLSDGTRRRRKGLANEASSTAEPIPTTTNTEIYQSYKWKNVGGDPDKSFIVWQVGQRLLFTNDDETPSASWHSEAVRGVNFSAETTLVAANISDNAMRFSQGRGHLFVSGPYMKPFYVSYDSVTDGFTATLIKLQYRDFEGIDDGVGVDETPTITTGIPDDHRYNLRNRGWRDADLTSLFGVNSKYPAKNGLWKRAYKRAFDSTAGSDPDGLLSLDEAKYDAEAFGNSSAPQGSVFLNPFDTTYAGVVSGGVAPIDIVTWTVADTSQVTWTITVNAVAHGLADAESVTISGNEFSYSYTEPETWDTVFVIGSLDGTHVINTTGVTSPLDNFEITINRPANWQAWISQYLDLGHIGSAGQTALQKSDGSVVQRGFEAIGFHAGRMWYAGMADTQFADHVFFSRVAENATAYGECHQRADPTDPDFNELTPADGGVLVIPGLAGVKDMMTIGNSLVLVGTEGAWEIAGNRGSVFTATAFGVRQLTNANLNSSRGTLTIEDSGIAVGPSGIYSFAPNEFTRQLEAKNMIQDTIQTKWNGFTTAEQQRAQVSFDDAKRRLYVMMGSTAATHHYNEMLILDTRRGSWFRYTFNAPAAGFGLLAMVAISDADDSSSNQKMKFLYHPTATTLQIADFQQTDYLDFDGLEAPLPYLVTGFDNLGDFQRRRQAPVITVFSKRTETGYTDTGSGFTGDNESSTLMTAFWDWTEATEYDVPSAPTAQRAWTGTTGNHGVSGKIGAQSEVYRHNRSFIPLASGDVDGYPTVVTRNKVRGRGRVLQLRFDGAATKDSHLIGWTTNYKISRKK